MTTISTPNPVPVAPRMPNPRGFVATVLLETAGRTGARVGIAWVALVVLLAVFAPFIANSHPYLLKTGGKWSSPLLQHLTPADVSVLVAFFAGVTLLALRRIGFAKRVWIFLGILALTIILSLVFIRPPKVVVYAQYREAAAAGEVEFVLNAPIPYSPADRMRDVSAMNSPHPWPPSGRHWLGTEAYGGDIASRMIHACRIALAVGFIAEGIAVVIGVIIGSLMGYFVGLVDLLGMRLVEIFSAIPQIYLLLAFVAYFGRNLYIIMVIIGLTSWTGFAVFTRAEFLRLRKLDFVQAAQAMGLPLRSILFRHMFPNGMSPVLVGLSFGVASAILAEATLSFLGLGLIDEPSWGQMLNQALGSGGKFVWWLATFPGLAIFLTVFAYNLIGEALRDAVDPHLKKASMVRAG